MGSIEPLAFTYASMFGIVTEEEYPYTSGDPTSNDDQVCDFDATTTDVSLITMGFETLPHNDALAVMDHLANKGNNTFTLRGFLIRSNPRAPCCLCCCQ